MAWFRKNWPLLLVLVIIAAAAGYLGFRAYRLNQNKVSLENNLVKTRAEFASTSQKLSDTIFSLQEELVQTKTERDNFEEAYYNEKNKIDDLTMQIGTIKDMVGVLEKLQKTDPELLKKYSKVYFLNENYIPETLVKIDEKYVYNSAEEKMIHEKVWPYLKEMLKKAGENDTDLLVISAYRSFGEQIGLKSSYLMVYGKGANSFSADQGYSEHQLGTTVDLTTSKTGDAYASFEKTQTYQWILQNAHKYGFILSYPENNTYFQFEPWHWRFVGKDLAGKLHEENKYFYELDQRLLDTYLLSIF